MSSELQPGSLKPLAWEGVRIDMPRSWDITGHRGFWDHGIIKAKSLGGPRLELAWRRANTRSDLAQQAAKLWPDVALRPWELSTGQPNIAISQGFTMGTGTNERRVLLAQTKDRLAVLTMLGVDQPLALRMARSLRVADKHEPRPFAALEFEVTAPADYELIKSEIKSGVCYFGWKQRRRHFQFRRFSAGHTAMGMAMEADLNGPDAKAHFEAWVSLLYARELADAHHNRQVEGEGTDRLSMTLKSKRRRFAAMEVTSLIPKHRKQFRHIQVVWDKPSRKIVCLESTHDDQAALDISRQVMDSFKAHPCPGVELRNLPVKTIVKCPDVAIKTTQGRCLVEIKQPRPKAIGWLPLLLGQKPNREPVIHKAELDPIGRWLWDQIGKLPLDEIIGQLQEHLSLSAREARMSIMTYLQILAKWRMIEFKEARSAAAIAAAAAAENADMSLTKS